MEHTAHNTERLMMRHAIHENYDKLTEREKLFVDSVFDSAYDLRNTHFKDVCLKGDDTVERAVDALARAVIESR
jgi:hypothetical protein